MFKKVKAYLVKGSNLVVLDKADAVHNAKDSDFEEVYVVIQMSEIKEWAEEIELLGLDEEDY